MKRINIVNFSKTMIFFSLVVLFSGIAFDFGSSRKLLNPKDDTYLITPNKSNDGTVSITTIDKNDVNGGKPASSDSSKKSYNTNSQSKFVDDEDGNNELRNSILSKYGISVK